MGSPGLKSDLTAVRLWESATHAAAVKSEAVPRSCSFDSDTPQAKAEGNDSSQNTRKQK